MSDNQGDQLQQKTKSDLASGNAYNVFQDVYATHAYDISDPGSHLSDKWARNAGDRDTLNNMFAGNPAMKDFQITDFTKDGKLAGKLNGQDVTVDEHGIVRNSKNQVIETISDDGSVQKFKYDENGQISEVTDKDGHVWKQNGQDHWEAYQSDGTTPYIPAGSNQPLVTHARIQMDCAGDYQITNLDTGSTEIYSTDGASLGGMKVQITSNAPQTPSGKGAS